MNDYTPNSHKFREGQTEQTEERKKVESVITSTPKVKKKTGAQKLAGALITEDASSIKQYFIFEVLIPIVKKALLDIIKNGADGIFGGKSGSIGTARVDKIAFRDYSAISRFGDVPFTPGNTTPTQRVYNYDKVVFDTREEANTVLLSMDGYLQQYGKISVADFYQMANVTEYDFTAFDFGWTDIRTAEILRVSDGYIIKLPKAMALNKN